MGYQEGILSLQDLGACLVAATKVLKQDADSMLLDLAKSRLDKDLTKRRTLSDIPEIPPTVDQSSAENVEVTEKANSEERFDSTLKVSDGDAECKTDKKLTQDLSATNKKHGDLDTETELAMKKIQKLNLTEVGEMFLIIFIYQVVTARRL